MAIENLTVTKLHDTDSIQPMGVAKIVFDADDSYPTGGYAIAIPLTSALRGFKVLLGVGEPQGTYRFSFDVATQKCKVLVEGTDSIAEVANETDLSALDSITLQCLIG